MSDAGALTGPVAAPRQPLLAVLPDARLAKLAAEGSSAAVATIYRRHHQHLYRYCRSILGNEHEAADALQNTMLKAMRALEGEQREISLKPWLFRIAHNEAIAIIRRRRPDEPLEHAASIATAEADPETRQRLRDLVGDLDRLTPRQRSALVMRELSGLGFDEIAVALETSPDAVKTSVYDARQALHVFETGREMTCEDVRRKVSDGDRRALRGRAIRAHFADCPDCERFAGALRERRRDLGAIATPLPAPAAAAILSRILEGGAGGGLAVLAGGTGAAGLGAGAALKVGVAGMIAVGGAAVAIKVGPGAGDGRVGDPAGAGPAQSAPADPAAAPAIGTEAAAASAGSPSGPDEQRAAGDGRGHGPGDQKGGGQQQNPNAGGTPANESAGPPASTPAPPGTGPATTPPGQGGTPPGQGGTPPGLGGPPPGQGGTPPGLGGPPPGQGGTPPAQAVTPPAQAATPPGLVAPPPGQAGTTPGQSGAAPAGTGPPPQAGPK